VCALRSSCSACSGRDDEPAPLAPAALCTLVREVRPNARPTMRCDHSWSGSVDGDSLSARIHAAEKRAAAAQSVPRRRASHRLCRARRSTGGRRRRGCEASGAGSSKVITGNRHHAAASNLDNSVARLHQSTVHTGCANHTCDVEIGPRYRLSQPMGTRMVTSHSWSAPTTCRPLTACGNSRPRLSLAAVELFGRPLRVRSPPRRRRPRPRA
jgi:hypothetical protein